MNFCLASTKAVSSFSLTISQMTISKDSVPQLVMVVLLLYMTVYTQAVLGGGAVDVSVTSSNDLKEPCQLP